MATDVVGDGDGAGDGAGASDGDGDGDGDCDKLVLVSVRTRRAAMAATSAWLVLIGTAVAGGTCTNSTGSIAPAALEDVDADEFPAEAAAGAMARVRTACRVR